MRIKKLLPALLFLFSAPAFAQNGDVENFIDDMLIIAGNFAQPAADGAAYQAGAGWFHSAATMEKWEVRISVHGNILFVPAEKRSFHLSNNDLALLQFVEESSAELPTAFGGATNMVFRGEINALGTTQEFTFDAIDGINRKSIPHAFVQATMGFPGATEVTFRGMPAINIDGVTASTYGIGVKHNFNQYFRFNDPGAVQFAAGISYSKLDVEYEFEPKGAEGIVMLDIINVDANLFLLEGIASKRWQNFEVFGALGVMNSGFNYTMGGTGAFLGDVNSELDVLEDSQFQYKGDLGFNLHFGRFRLSTMATLGEFFNGNLGLHVRI